MDRITLCRRWLAACFAALFVLTCSRAASPEGTLAAQRTEFRQAYEKITNAARVASTDSASLRGYVLYPYLQAARLAQALGTAGTSATAALDEQVAGFLQDHRDEPVAQDLRRRWLASLADRASWNRYLPNYRDANDGAVLRCHAFTARIELERTDGLAAEVVKAWLTPRSLQECERAFEWLRSTGALSEALVEQRVRLALENGNASFARQIAGSLPANTAAPLLRWAALIENPRRETDALLAAPQDAVEIPALLDGWTRLARADRTAATQLFERLVRTRKLDERAASRFALALALPLAWDRDAEALAYFARVDDSSFDDSAREWQARAALWAGDWKLVSRSIAAMSDGNRRTARWRYWAARAAAQAGEDAAARQLYESILAEDNYYSAMAAARLNRSISPNVQTVAVDAAQLASLGNLASFLRARELRVTGLVSNAQAEWRAGLDSLQPAARVQAIRLAAGWGWYDQAVATATAERVFNDYVLLYPRPHDAEVAAAAQLSGLPADTIYAVIRQESLYSSDAVSSAGAHGLMQLLPETARQTARQWKQPTPSRDALFEPRINIVLGAAHLKDLLDRVEGQLPLALAAYNAGPGAMQRWLPGGGMDPDVWIENIPYNETRTYVQRILWHSVVFGWLRSAAAQDTRQWLNPVTPPAALARR